MPHQNFGSAVNTAVGLIRPSGIPRGDLQKRDFHDSKDFKTSYNANGECIPTRDAFLEDGGYKRREYQNGEFS